MDADGFYLITLFIITAVPSLAAQNNPRKRYIDRNVCFPEIGCFNNSAPFDNAEGVLPDPPATVGTHFLLLTRKNGLPDLIPFQNDSGLRLSHFNPHKEVKVLIHGFSQSAAVDWIKDTADALLEQKDCNVLVVDWGPGAKFPHYLQATANTRLVGAQLRILLNLMIDMGASAGSMHLIGHSLGAHIAGYAGKGLKKQVAHITGLDPADPLFESKHEDVRLDASDADFVDIVHTNGKPIYLGSFGMYKEIGHADFYINGGHLQPGCSKSLDALVNDIVSGKVNEAMDSITCSHSRAHDIYLESIKSMACRFMAYRCKSTDDFNAGRCLSCQTHKECAHMGYTVNATLARGKYFMKTRATTPFCGLHYGITLTTAEDGKTKGQILLKFIGADGKESDTRKLFHNDESLRPGHPHEAVMVVSHDVDDIAAIEVTYLKHSSWLIWTNGEKEWLPENIEITPGGRLNSNAKLFCLNGVKLQDKKPATFKIEDYRCKV